MEALKGNAEQMPTFLSKAKNFDKFCIYFLWVTGVIDPVGMIYGMRYFALVLVFISICFKIFSENAY